MLNVQIQDIREKLGKKVFKNEFDVSLGCVLPILQALKWPIFDPSIVAHWYYTPEYALDTRCVYFALLSADTQQATVFIEVKNIGKASAKGEKQLFEYAFYKGVQLVLLVDGKTWSFYLPAEQGSFEERKVKAVNLAEDFIEDCETTLVRYLERKAVDNGQAISSARSDYQRRINTKLIKKSLNNVNVWESLIEKRNLELFQMMQQAVKEDCGHEPDSDQVFDFFDTFRWPFPEKGEGKGRRELSSFTLKGDKYTFSGVRKLLPELVKTLEKNYSGFVDKFIGINQTKNYRMFIAHDLQIIYPRSSPEWSEKNTVEVVPGYFMGLNHNRKAQMEIIKLIYYTLGAQESLLLSITIGEEVVERPTNLGQSSDS